MTKRTLSILLLALLGLVVLAACEATGDTNEDPEAAQNFFPTLENYSVYATDDMQDGISTALAGAGVASGNFMLSGLVLKIDDFIECYRDVGAFDARIYTENITTEIVTGEGAPVPTVGFLVIVNEDRLARNLGPCLTTGASGDVRAMSAAPEPCTGNGQFTFNDESIGYLYVASDTPLCQQFATHFAQFDG